MIELTEYEKEYWKDRASEPLRFEPYPDDVCDAYNKDHPLPTQEELDDILRRYEA